MTGNNVHSEPTYPMNMSAAVGVARVNNLYLCEVRIIISELTGYVNRCSRNVFSYTYVAGDSIAKAG